MACHVCHVVETVKTVFGRELSKAVNPDEAMTIGASIQAGALTGNVTDILLYDVTPLSFGMSSPSSGITRLTSFAGIETIGDIMTTSSHTPYFLHQRSDNGQQSRQCRCNARMGAPSYRCGARVPRGASHHRT